MRPNRIAVTAIGLLVLGGCQQRQPLSALEAQRLQAALANEYSSRSLLQAEPEVLATTGDARRLGSRLTLTTAAGTTVVLVNDDDGCPKPSDNDLPALGNRCVSFALVAHPRSEHFFVVAQLFYEGGDFILIDDRSGRRITVPDIPQFAPDHSAFIVLHNDESSGDAGAVQIWRRQGDGAELEWRHHFDAWPLTLVDWVGMHITLDIGYSDAVNGAIRRLIIDKNSLGWHISSIASQSTGAYR